MPRKLRSLSGEQVVRIFEIFGFVRISQKGSHVKLRRQGPEGDKQTLVVPFHSELDRGTLRALFRQACVYIPDVSLAIHFYTDDE